MGYPGPFPFKVEQGGTGEIALTANAVLIGQNPDDITVTNVGTNGQVLLGATGLPPAFATLTSTGGTVSFTLGANSLNLEAGGSVAINFDGDSGTATPALNTITMAGGNNIVTSAAGSTVTFDLNGTTDHAVQIGNAGGSLTSISVGTNGQVLLGATGADPAFATLTSTGGTIVFTPGANSLNLEASGSTAASFPTDSGTAVPALGALTIAGGANIATSGAGSTVTIDLDGIIPIANGGTNASSMATTDGTVIFDGTRLVTTATGTAGQVLTSNGAGVAPTYQPVSASGAVTSVSGGNNITITGTATAPIVNVSGTTNHAVQVGNATNSLTSLGVGTNGQVLLGSTAADPSFVTPTAGTGLSITTNATTLQYAVASTVAITFAADSGTATPSANTITIAGGTNCTTSASGSTVTIDATGGTSFTWNEETGTSASMAVNNGYIANNAGLVTLTLPSTAAVGDVVRVSGKGAGGWRIAQNSGQTIYFGTSTTTTGAGGRLDSSHRRDGIELLCVTANNDWNVLSAQGNITVT